MAFCILKISKSLGLYFILSQGFWIKYSHLDFVLFKMQNILRSIFTVIHSKENTPMGHICTLNGNAKIILKLPQTLDSESITPFIADSYCILCRTLSRVNITNKISKMLKLQHQKRIEEDRRYLCCRDCKERGCDTSVKLFYDFF